MHIRNGLINSCYIGSPSKRNIHTVVKLLKYLPGEINISVRLKVIKKKEIVSMDEGTT